MSGALVGIRGTLVIGDFYNCLSIKCTKDQQAMAHVLEKRISCTFTICRHWSDGTRSWPRGTIILQSSSLRAKAVRVRIPDV